MRARSWAMPSIDELKKIPLFASLSPAELDYLARSVPDMHVVKGDYVVHEGDAPALIVVAEGKLEVTKMMDGEERVIGTRGDRPFKVIIGVNPVLIEGDGDVTDFLGIYNPFIVNGVVVLLFSDFT